MRYMDTIALMSSHANTCWFLVSFSQFILFNEIDFSLFIKKCFPIDTKHLVEVQTNSFSPECNEYLHICK